MSDLFYKFVVAVGRHPFVVSSRPVVLHRDRVPRAGPFLLAANHSSPYDVPLLMRHTPRPLDFVSITELFRNPLVAHFFTALNVFPLDRSRPDHSTTKTILNRLAAGRPVAIFPEGRFRPMEQSVLLGRPVRPGTARLARMAGCPILPVAVVNSAAYRRPSAWLPLRRTRYGLAYGEPIVVADDAAGEQALAAAFQALYAEIQPLI